MSLPSSAGRLVLTPWDPYAFPRLSALLEVLQGCGLIGSVLYQGLGTWWVGEGFLSWISFTGCSPHIRMEPPPGGNGSFCHILLEGPYATPRLLWGRNTRPPRCPNCRGVIADWPQRRASWSITPHQPFHCPRCEETINALSLRWRDSGGFGRGFLVVEDIFPGEAVPVPGLFEQLGTLGAGPWHHFYIQDMPTGLTQREDSPLA